MPIKLENVGIAVRDLEATISLLTDLGLTVLGRDTVSGQWTDTAVGLDGNHAKIGMHRMAFSVDDLDAALKSILIASRENAGHQGQGWHSSAAYGLLSALARP